MKVMGLFSGIGGFELAFSKRDIDCVGLCDIEPAAQAVLTNRFPGIPVYGDVQLLKSINGADVIAAGFPCQDLSQAGAKAGIKGARSGLIDDVFRLMAAGDPPEWVLLENVSYMLRLKQGQAVQYVLKRAEALGYNWAYRVIDARCFGLPQRRERVVILLSRSHNPGDVLFPTGYVEPAVDDTVGAVDADCYYGFYWTEGKRGLGWVKNAVPTIKGGSGLGIPSPPAIWDPARDLFGTPSIADAERMFGFPPGWTEAAREVSSREGARWKLVGNTVCVPMMSWTVAQILEPRGIGATTHRLTKASRPPSAAFSYNGRRFAVTVSPWVQEASPPKLNQFLSEPLKPLSHRAATGFYSRALQSTTIRFADGFLESIRRYIATLEQCSERGLSTRAALAHAA